MVGVLPSVLVGLGVCLILRSGVVRTAIRNVAKGQASHVQRGHRQPWKKDTDPAVPGDTNAFWTAVDMIKWSVFSEIFRFVGPFLFPQPNITHYDVRSYPGVQGLVAVTIDDAFCRQSPAQHSLADPLRRLLAKHAVQQCILSTAARPSIKAPPSKRTRLHYLKQTPPPHHPMHGIKVHPSYYSRHAQCSSLLLHYLSNSCYTNYLLAATLTNELLLH